MRLWIKTTRLTKVALTGKGLRKRETNVSTTAQIADSTTTNTTDSIPNC